MMVVLSTHQRILLFNHCYFLFPHADSFTSEPTMAVARTTLMQWKLTQDVMKV